MLRLVQKPGDPNAFKAPHEVQLAHLVCNSDGVDPEVFELSTGSKCRLVLGRGSATLPVDVEINAKRDGKEIISRQHAEIFVSSKTGKHTIKDMNSLNGVFVNNLCIDTHELKEGDLIQFGGVAKVPVGHLINSTDVCLKYVYISANNKDFLNHHQDSTLASSFYPSSYADSAHSHSVETTPTLNGSSAMCSSYSDGKYSRFVKNDNASTDHGGLLIPTNGVSTPIGTNNSNRYNSADGSKTYNNNSNNNSNSGSRKKQSGERDLHQTSAVIERAVDEQSLTSIRSETLRRVVEMENKVAYLQEQNKKLADENAVTQSISNTQLTLIHQQITQLEALRESVNTITDQKTEIEETLNRKQQEIADLLEENSNLKKSNGSLLVNGNGGSSAALIDHSSLHASLCCALCSEPILDAAILSCSHGFCLYCIESHWEWHTDYILNRGNDKTVSHSSITSNKTLCPSCNSIFPTFNRESIIHSSTSIISDHNRNSATALQRLKVSIRKWRFTHGLQYFRSSHLDNMVWLLNEVSPQDERLAFRAREVRHSEGMKRLKLSSLPEVAANKAQRVLHDDSEGGSDDDSDDDSEKDGEDEIEDNRNSNPRKKYKQTSEKKHKDKGKADNESISIYCGYCLEAGHEDHECPYDENLRS